MKKILVPSDFSETSENAFVYAIEMAKAYNARLVLLHTFELPMADSQIMPINYAEMYETLEASNSDNFMEELEKLKMIARQQNATHIFMDHVMMEGDLLHCIKEVVSQQDIDFVVMGTNGATGWLESFIGTNTGNVISDVSVPVLSVSHDTKFNKIETIGFTTRYRQDEIHALNQVLKIARRFDAKVKCLYVKTPEYEFIGQEIAHWESYFEDEKDLEFFIIPSEDVEATIEEFVDNQRIDLLAMVSHKKNFFARLFTTSTTQKMSQHSKTPILALHE